jgi:microcystin-dependent protein
VAINDPLNQLQGEIDARSIWRSVRRFAKNYAHVFQNPAPAAESPGSPGGKNVVMYDSNGAVFFLQNDDGVFSRPFYGGIEGEIKAFPFEWGTPPSGWLRCNGAAVSRATYVVLFGRVGTTYGAGDGTTTFNLPDDRDAVPIGGGGALVFTNGITGANTRDLRHPHFLPNHVHPGPSHAHGDAHDHDGPLHDHGLQDHTHSGTTDFEGDTPQVVDSSGTSDAANETHQHDFVTGGPTPGRTSQDGTGKTTGQSPTVTDFAGTGNTSNPTTLPQVTGDGLGAAESIVQRSFRVYHYIYAGVALAA